LFGRHRSHNENSLRHNIRAASQSYCLYQAKVGLGQREDAGVLNRTLNGEVKTSALLNVNRDHWIFDEDLKFRAN